VITQGTSNSYRHYDGSDVERAVLIKLGQALGFTLREIKELMLQWESDSLTDQMKIEVMQQKLQDIDQRIRGLNDVKRYFKAKIQWIQASGQAKPPAFKDKTTLLNPAADQSARNLPKRR